MVGLLILTYDEPKSLGNPSNGCPTPPYVTGDNLGAPLTFVEVPSHLYHWLPSVLNPPVSISPDAGKPILHEPVPPTALDWVKL